MYHGFPVQKLQRSIEGIWEYREKRESKHKVSLKSIWQNKGKREQIEMSGEETEELADKLDKDCTWMEETYVSSDADHWQCHNSRNRLEQKENLIFFSVFTKKFWVSDYAFYFILWHFCKECGRDILLRLKF